MKKCSSSEMSDKGIIGDIIHGEEEDISFEEEEPNPNRKEEENVELPTCHGVSSGNADIVYPDGLTPQ